MSKKKSPVKVKILTKIEFPSGIIISSEGKGKMKGQNIKIMSAPANFYTKEVPTTTSIILGNKNMLAEKTEKGYKII